MKTKKHNHTLTNLLKVFVFSLMILMPFIIFIPNAFYYGFNEQAIAQEKTEQVPVYYESNEVETYEDILIGNVYYWNDNIGQMPTQSSNSNYLYIKILNGQYANNNYTFSRLADGYMGIIDSQNNVIVINQVYFDFLVVNYESNYTYLANYVKNHIIICPRKYIKKYQPLTTNMSITDSMSYAWKSTWQNELFSWTGNTAIYTGINTTTSGIGISENSYIANYLAYIFLLTIIYVIVDIILGAFTMLTHLFNKEPK